MKQLYVVAVFYDLVVLADSPEEAQEEARHIDDVPNPRTNAAPLRSMPPEWNKDCIPWGFRDPSDRDRTIGKWIELGAAPAMSPVELRVPPLGEGIPAASVTSVAVRTGDTVVRDQILITLETDKADIEVRSPINGKVTAVHAAVGAEWVPIGALLCVISPSF